MVSAGWLGHSELYRIWRIYCAIDLHHKPDQANKYDNLKKERHTDMPSEEQERRQVKADADPCHHRDRSRCHRLRHDVVRRCQHESGGYQDAKIIIEQVRQGDAGKNAANGDRQRKLRARFPWPAIEPPANVNTNHPEKHRDKISRPLQLRSYIRR